MYKVIAISFSLKYILRFLTRNKQTQKKKHSILLRNRENETKSKLNS